MNETKFKILTTLTENIGNSISINKLTKYINKNYNNSYYNSIYYKIKELEINNDIFIDKIGKSSIINLNFDNPILIDLLSQVELRKKEFLLKDYPELKTLILNLEIKFQKNFLLIESFSIIKPIKYISLNRAEFLIILKDISPDYFNNCSNSEEIKKEIIKNEKIKIYQTMYELEKKFNLKLDFLILTNKELLQLIEDNNNNITKDMILNQTILLYPQNYWINIKELLKKNIRLKNNFYINPGKLTKKDFIYNLNKFGYKEIGLDIPDGNNYRLEFIILSILLSNDARKKEAIPILIKKNISSENDLNLELLLFYSKKYNKLQDIFAYLKILYELYKDNSLQYPIRLLENLKISPKRINKQATKEKLRLYYGKTRSK